MRILHVIKGELRFLWKYKLIAIYFLFSLVYVGIIEAVPADIQVTTAQILIFTDPAAMGLFFMGAVVLLEKSQRVHSSLAVSPMTLGEYIMGKVVPLMVIGTCVSVLLALYAGAEGLLYVIIGVALASILFSLCGLSVACRISSVNGFVIAMVPFEVFLFVPALLYQFDIIKSQWFMLHPGVAGISLVLGEGEKLLPAVASLLFWIGVAAYFCRKCVKRSLQSLGGAKL